MGHPDSADVPRDRVVVDGQVFDVTRCASQPGGYYYAWLDAPRGFYGFSGGWSWSPRGAQAQHEAAIRRFLGIVGSVTHLGRTTDDECRGASGAVEQVPGPRPGAPQEPAVRRRPSGSRA